MSLYIHQENQKLIWESINKIPLFQTFGKNSPGKQEAWFREIIQQFYESNKFKLLSVEDLQQLNRETVSYMLHDLDKQNSKHTPVTFYPGFSSSFGEMSPVHNEKQMVPFSSSMPLNNATYTRDAILEKKQEQLNQQFSIRQQEYGNMLKVGPTHDINFRVNLEDDTPIENIEMLIQEKMKQREYDLNSPPHSSPALDVIDLGKNVQGEYEMNNARIRSDKFPYKDITDNPPKNVRWNEQTQNEPIKHRPPQYSRANDNLSVFKDFMEDVKDTMNNMRKEIQSLKQQNNYAANNTTTAAPKQNPLVNNILSRMKRTTNTSTNRIDLQDVTNDFTYEDRN